MYRPNRKDGTIGSILVATAIYGGFVGYRNLVEIPRMKAQAYNGRISEAQRERDWFVSQKYGGDLYDYYWEVRCSDGKTRRIEVPPKLWKQGKVGDPVRKRKGQVDPVLLTSKKRQHRNFVEQVGH